MTIFVLINDCLFQILLGQLTLSTIFENSTKLEKDGLRHSRGAKSSDSILITFSPGLKWLTEKKNAGQKLAVLSTPQKFSNHTRNVFNPERF